MVKNKVRRGSGITAEEYYIDTGSSYALNGIDVHMKERFYDVMAMVSKEKMEIIDFNETDYFDDNDFVDPDHMNGRGAYKMSMLLAAT